MERNRVMDALFWDYKLVTIGMDSIFLNRLHQQCQIQDPSYAPADIIEFLTLELIAVLAPGHRHVPIITMLPFALKVCTVVRITWLVIAGLKIIAGRMHL